ncbi:MAG: protein translocase subunit SecF [Candidatus Magasanikbacteria bacterium]|jgi:preprotein translocase subunit SecF|nr:protein translocase subunit SecF [Candidatus Magasanikbacteria bacterium]
MLQIVEKRKIPFIISGVLFIASLVLLAVFGLKPGIDFTGGSLIELRFTQERPALHEVQETLAGIGFEGSSVQPTGEDGYILKTRFVTEDEHQQILTAMRDDFFAPGVAEVDATMGEDGKLQINADPELIEAARGEANLVIEERIEAIGPVISSEMSKRSWEAGFVVVIAIIFFVAYAFRRVSQPVSSWKYGITAIIALVHDVVITMGIFALLGYFLNVEIDIPFIVALLTILGYSVNDTIVVFDRIREKLIKRGRKSFAETVNMGVNETITRSVNTSITTLLVLTALFLFGGETIRYFSLTLIVGVILGTYSSIFLASPLLVVWQRLAGKR